MTPRKTTPSDETMPTSPWLVNGSMVLVQVMFGVQYLAAKVVLAEIPPALWALIRVAAAATVLFGIVALMRRPLPSWPIVRQLAFYSVFGVVINQLCFVEGLSRTTAGHSSIIMTSIPVCTLLFAVLLRREQVRIRKLASLVIAFGGVLLVIRPDAATAGTAMVRGDLLTLANAMSYSLFLVVSKRVLARTDPLSATAVIFAFGTLGMALPGLPAAAGFHPADVSASVWALGIFIVLFPTALGYLLTYWALARIESSAVALFIYLQPVIATTLSVFLFGERLAPATVIGAGLIFLAVYLAMRPSSGTATA